MFKINSYSLFFWAVLFLHNPNVFCFSSSLHNDSSLPPTQSQQSLFPNILPQVGNNDSAAPLFPIGSSVAPQLFNWPFNSSTHTFIPPLMLSRWGNNMSTGTFSINSFSLPITNDSISGNTAINQNDNTALPVVHETQQQLSHPNQDKDHVLSENKKNTKTYKCPTCNKALASQRTLKAHLKTHDPNRLKPYQCTLCNKCFATKNTLRFHIRTHTGEKLFKCEVCGKGLSTKETLINHLNIHKGIKPYSCEECKKSFRTKKRLKEHRKFHKNPKPYKCDQCTKAYTSKYRCNEHMKMHDSVQLYTCKYCRANFLYKSKYEDHIRYEEETDEDRKCHICKKTYISNYNLKQHNKRAHPELK